MKIHLRIHSPAAKAQLRLWGGTFRRKVRQAVAVAMGSEATNLRSEVRSHVAGQLKVVKRTFLKSFVVKLLDQDPARFAALYIGARIPWASMHEYGGRIAGRMLIPLHGRVGRKRFKAQITALIRGGNAYFIKSKRGNIVLMAENLKEHERPLAGFKRGYRKAAGLKRLKRGADIPIAVLVPKVVLKKRLDIEGLVAARIPRLTSAIEAQIAALQD